MREYTRDDCSQTGYDFSLKGKVVVLDRAALPPEHPGQLFFCMGENGANPNPIGRSVFLVSLTNGESCRFMRRDVTGTLKCNAALYSRRKKHFIFDSINTITAPSFR